METMFLPGQSKDILFLTEDGLYEVLMLSRKPIAKELKKQIKQYLRNIRLTGAAIEQGREEDMVKYYFDGFSNDIKYAMVQELEVKNKVLQSFYNDLMSTDGLLSMNEVSKELNVLGQNKLYEFLRKHKLLFYKNGSNCLGALNFCAVWRN